MTIYDKIYQKAEPYWQTRRGEIHMPLAYKFAQQLLVHYPEADEAVVLPAILLHDTGWHVIPDDLQKQALVGSPKSDNKPDISRLHETEGARIAGELLASLDYEAAKINEIQQIIDGHDTRQESLSLNDALVKDADKLWRFDPVGAAICAGWNGMAVAPFLDFFEARIETIFFTEQAKAIARSLLVQSRSNNDR
jgi:HD superfamily phosphodiesterase